MIGAGEGGQIYQLPVTRGASGHVTGFGTTVLYSTSGVDAGLAFGPGGVLFAKAGGASSLYEFKPGSNSPDLTVDLTAFGYPPDGFGTLQFVPSWLSGSWRSEGTRFENPAWYDVALSANGSHRRSARRS